MTTEKLKGFSSAFQPWSFFLGDVSWDFVASGATAGHIDDGYFVSALLRCCYAVVQVGANNQKGLAIRSLYGGVKACHGRFSEQVPASPKAESEMAGCV